MSMDQQEQQRQEQIKKALGERIRNLRRNKGWSQKAVSELCGVSRSHLSQLERGELDAGLAMLAAIAGALKITVSRLFHGIA